jgi:hypothetical protein
MQPYCAEHPGPYKWGSLIQAGNVFPIDEPSEEQKEAAQIYVYSGSWSIEVPCMYCGAGLEEENETCIAYHAIKGTVCQILYCAVESKPCMARSREDRDKVTALFAAHKAEQKAKAEAAKTAKEVETK